MTKLKRLALVLAFFGSLTVGAGLLAQQKGGGGADQTRGLAPIDPAIKALIEARRESARKVYELTMLRHLNIPELFPDDTPVWSRRWMEEELRLGPDPAGKLSAIQDHLERVKGLEGIMDRYARAGQGQTVQVFKMRYYRLEAEQRLAEARAAFPDVPLPKPRVSGRDREAATPQPPPPPASPR